MSEKIKVGISSCLLGDEVRYNGGHKQSNLCLNRLSKLFDYDKFCPEMAAGMGVPRPTIRLEGDPEQPRLVYSPGPQRDAEPEPLNSRLRQGYSQKLKQLENVDGYILMQKSPSCGMERVKVYQRPGNHSEPGRGVFAAELMKQNPCLPVEEDGRLHDHYLLENFVLRVVVHRQFRQQVDGQGFAQLLDFHSRHKYLVMAHSVPSYKALGALLAKHNKGNFCQQRQEYFVGLMAALAKPARRKGHANALMHMLGYLKTEVDGEQRQDMVKVIHQYRVGEIQLESVMTLLRHYLQAKGSDYIKQQVYLQPYPEELGLRNYI